MPRENFHSARPGQTRRQFLKKTGAGTLAVAGAGMFQLPFSTQGHQSEPSIALVLDPADSLTRTAPVQWAAGQLRDALAARGFPVQSYLSLDAVSSWQTAILVAGRTFLAARQVLDAARISLADAPECLALARGKAQNHSVILAAGSDERGLVYALLELADRVNFADNPRQMLQTSPPVSERPANRIRGIARSFVSDVEDKPWFQDRDFWPPYLTMLAAHRFNRFNLALGIGYDFTTGIRDCYFHFAYPFFLAVPGYDVRAIPSPTPSATATWKCSGSSATKPRGAASTSNWAFGPMLTNGRKAPTPITSSKDSAPATHALYCRDALRALLTACPAISGVTFRIHGESGVPEGKLRPLENHF